MIIHVLTIGPPSLAWNAKIITQYCCGKERSSLICCNHYILYCPPMYTFSLLRVVTERAFHCVAMCFPKTWPQTSVCYIVLAMCIPSVNNGRTIYYIVLATLTGQSNLMVTAKSIHWLWPLLSQTSLWRQYDTACALKSSWRHAV
jgi:hypothetical protein